MLEYNNPSKVLKRLKGDCVSQIIKTSTPGKERTKLSKAIVITIREFMRQNKPDQDTKDMTAFVILALSQIASGIDQSVAAWEKRGYWVKADKYRLEWQWTGELSKNLETALLHEEWQRIATFMLEIANHFQSIKVSDQHRMGRPWINAYKILRDLDS
jgi:hypothetical protein